MGTESQLDKVRKLIGDGAEQAGAGIGVVLGWHLFGPDGAAAGAVSGTAIKQVIERVGADVSDRLLGPRERYKIGTALGFAVSRIEANYSKGKRPVEPKFFRTGEKERTKAEEVLEGLLLKAKDAYEEKKLPYLGNFYGNAPFMHSFHVLDVPHLGFWLEETEMNLYLEYANDLSYRQMLILALIERKDEFQLRSADYLKTTDCLGNVAHNGFPMRFPTVGILEEILDLSKRGMIAMKLPNGKRAQYIHDGRQYVPSQLILHPTGAHLYGLLGLDEAPHDEIQALVAQHLV